MHAAQTSQLLDAHRTFMWWGRGTRKAVLVQLSPKDKATVTPFACWHQLSPLSAELFCCQSSPAMRGSNQSKVSLQFYCKPIPVHSGKKNERECLYAHIPVGYLTFNKTTMAWALWTLGHSRGKKFRDSLNTDLTIISTVSFSFKICLELESFFTCPAWSESQQLSGLHGAASLRQHHFSEFDSVLVLFL